MARLSLGLLAGWFERVACSVEGASSLFSFRCFARPLRAVVDGEEIILLWDV